VRNLVANRPGYRLGNRVTNRLGNRPGFINRTGSLTESGTESPHVRAIASRPVLTRPKREPDPTRPITFLEEELLETPNPASSLQSRGRAREDFALIGRLTVRSVACVECGAEPGQPCIGKRGPRLSNHATRIESYLVRSALEAA
jgi:hypothetical protein